MIPLVGGVSLFLAVLFYPNPIPLNRVVVAAILLLSDISIIMLLWLPFYLLFFHKEDSDSSDPGATA